MTPTKALSPEAGREPMGLTPERWAEWITEGVWDVPAIETRDEFRAAVAEALRQVAHAAALTERARLQKFYRGLLDSLERARPLCPDHRDKQRGDDCMVCLAALRSREQAEARREEER
jgi:hypothetical protein